MYFPKCLTSPSKLTLRSNRSYFFLCNDSTLSNILNPELTHFSVFVHPSSSSLNWLLEIQRIQATLIVICPFIYINCKHSTLNMDVNVVKGMFDLYKTQNVNSWQPCMWMLKGKNEQGDPYKCKTVVPPGMCSFWQCRWKKKKKFLFWRDSNSDLVEIEKTFL